MRFSFKKLLVGGITSAIIATTVATSISASNESKFTITPTATSVKAGGSFDVNVAYVPGGKGVAAFTIDLKYDPSKVEVHVPTDAEMDGKYSVSTKFDFVSYNYQYASGTVRITGLKSKNLTANSDLALVTFKAKKGVTGKMPFWIEANTVTTIDSDGGYLNASYSAPTKSSPKYVTIKSTTTTTTTAKKTTTTAKKTTTTTKKTTTTAKKTTTKATTTTTKATTTTPKPTTTTTKVTTTTPKPTTTTTTTPKPATTTSKRLLAATRPASETVTEAATTSAEPETSVSTTAQETSAPETTTSKQTEVSGGSDPNEPDSTPVFSYTYEDEGEYTERDEANYQFRLSDYAKDLDKAYDITLKISANSTVNGAISYNNIDGEVCTETFSIKSGSGTWKISNVSVKELDDVIYVPIYFMANGATFKIEDVIISEYGKSSEIQMGTSDNQQPTDETIGDEDDPAVTTAGEEAVTNVLTTSAEPTSEASSSTMATESSDEDKAVAEDDTLSDTGGVPAAVLILLPIAMIGVTVVTIVKLRKGIK